MPEVTIRQQPPVPTAAIREHIAMADIRTFFDGAFAELGAALADQGVTPAGPPYARYHRMQDRAADVEVGFPVARGVTAAGRVRPCELPGGEVHEVVHRGSYEHLADTYGQLAAGPWRDAPPEAMWEVYVSDPATTPAVELVTLICWL